MKSAVMHQTDPHERGTALLVAVLVLALFLALGIVLLVQSQTETVVATNEQDHLKTLQAADAGMEWARRTVSDQAGAFSDVLDGPDNASTSDDNLIGLRDLSLTNTTQLTDSNESTASAIVTRDFFGDGAKTYEALRLPDSANKKTLLYMRVEDDYDDDPDNPANNDPLVDTDNRVKLTVVSEYPVFVDGNGDEVPNRIDDRPRARSAIEGWLYGGPAVAAFVTNNDLDVPGGPRVCGACGSMHANDDIDLTGSSEVCKNVTATDTATVKFPGKIGGTVAGGRAKIPVPVINPFDDLYVPAPEMFDTSAIATLPAELRCAGPSTADPGNSKYFALVAAGGAGLVYKAYYDFANNRWNWKLIDDLDDGTDVKLDPCGRAPGDALYTVGVTDKVGVANGNPKQFYGFSVKSPGTLSCPSCGSAGDDGSLCNIANNDFNRNGRYDENGTFQATPVLPGNFEPDTVLDFDTSIRHDGKQWSHSNGVVYSPVYNSVIFVKGNLDLSSGIGGGLGLYCDTALCPVPGSIPGGMWSVSHIVEGYINVGGTPSYRPLDTQDFSFLLIAGRDIEISGSPGGNDVCPTTCSTTPPSPADAYSGIIATHEELRISGGPNVMGFVLVESAVDCEDLVDGDGRFASSLAGDFHLYYDCNNPPNPWQEEPRLVEWHEIE